MARLVPLLVAVGCCAASRPASVKPFSAVVRADYYSESGRLERSVLLHYFRYSDRSFIIQQADLQTSKDMVTQIVDITGRRQIFLEPVARSASTLSFSDDHVDRFAAGLWDETCATSEDGVTDSKPGGAFFGHESTHIKRFGVRIGAKSAGCCRNTSASVLRHLMF